MTDRAVAAAVHRPLRIAMVHLSDFRVDSRIQRLAGALAARGDQVDLICIGEHEEVRVGAGVIRAHPVPCHKPGGGLGGYLRGYGRFLAGAMARLTLLDLRRHFDLIEAHNMPDLLTAAALVPRLRGTPVILNVHDTFPELFATMFGRSSGEPLVRLIELEERWGAKLAARATACSASRGRRAPGTAFSRRTFTCARSSNGSASRCTRPM